MSRFGLFEIIFSDREPVYKSHLMDLFCKEYDIEKNFSSAMYSQSNGQIERAIGHVKNIIKRCNGNMCDIRMCLLDYHATPLDSNLGSPHNIVMNRNVKTKIPCVESKLITESDKLNRKVLIERQQNSCKYYNRNAKSKCDSFNPGDIVVFRNNNADRTWKRAKVVAADSEFRSYTLLNMLGNLITRNRSMILPDKTGRDFFVSHSQLSETARQSPNPQAIASSKTRLQTLGPVVSSPPQNKDRFPSLEMRKSVISPEQSKELKLREYIARHQPTKSSVLDRNRVKEPIQTTRTHAYPKPVRSGTSTVAVRQSDRLKERTTVATTEPVRRSKRLAQLNGK
jgi:hypothetical protein